MLLVKNCLLQVFTLSGLNKCHTLCGNSLFAADSIQSFTGFGLQTHSFHLDLQDFGQAVANRLSMREQFGALKKHDAIDVYYVPTQRAHGIQRSNEHFGGVAAAILRISIRKHLSDVAEGCRTQEGIDHGMKQNVAVAVSDGLSIVGNIDAAQPQRTAGPQPVKVVPNTDT